MWKYKNTLLLLLSIIVLFLFADSQIVHALIREIGRYGYVGSFVSGIFFVSTFTVVPATIVLFHLSEEFNQVLISLSAGLGAVIGDFVIFRFLKDKVFEEIRPLFQKLLGRYFSVLFKNPYFSWLVPVIGMLIIASPFPDEVGIGLMGLSKIKTRDFLLLTFVLNTIGIFLVLSLIKAF